MKLFTLVICLILFLCTVDKTEGDLSNFFLTLPSEIGNALTSAWKRITETIRKPVRIKRLGHGGKRKTTATPWTTTTKYTTPDLTSMHAYFLSSTTRSLSVKHRIPLIPKPTWFSYLERNTKKAKPKSIKSVKLADLKKCKNKFNGAYKRKMAADGYNEGIYGILFFV